MSNGNGNDPCKVLFPCEFCEQEASADLIAEVMEWAKRQSGKVADEKPESFADFICRMAERFPDKTESVLSLMVKLA